MEPEEKLWKLHCITYSVAVAWRHVNDDYQRTPWGRKQRPRNVKCGKENFAGRQLLSEASGEHEAIQKQSKMTKRRVKRRKQISAKCRTLFVKDLTEFIEKLKQQFQNSLNIHDVVAQRERLIPSQVSRRLNLYSAICIAKQRVCLEVTNLTAK